MGSTTKERKPEYSLEFRPEIKVRLQDFFSQLPDDFALDRFLHWTRQDSNDQLLQNYKNLLEPCLPGEKIHITTLIGDAMRNGARNPGEIRSGNYTGPNTSIRSFNPDKKAEIRDLFTTLEKPNQ